MACLKISEFPAVPNRVVTNKFNRPGSSLARPQLSTPQCGPTMQICTKEPSVYTTAEKSDECSLPSTSGGQDEKNSRKISAASYSSSVTSEGPSKRYVDRGEYAWETQLKFTEEQLKRKSEELKKMTEKNSILLEIIEKSKNKNNENIKMIEMIENLYKSRNEFKIGYLDASKERDDATEAVFELKHKLTKMEKLVDKYASEEKQRRANYVHHSLELSDLAEKNKELHEENRKLKETISTLEQTVQKCLDENTESTEKIVKQEETISELKDEIRSWETGVECKLSTVIRNEFQPRFDEKNTEIVRLNRKLNKTVANNSVELTCLKKNNEVKQATIDMQQGVINLLKELKKEPCPTDQNLLRLHQRMDDFLLEYEDILSFMNSKFYRNWLKETSY